MNYSPLGLFPVEELFGMKSKEEKARLEKERLKELEKQKVRNRQAFTEVKSEMLRCASAVKSKTKLKLPWKLTVFNSGDDIEPYLSLEVFQNEWVMNESSEKYIEGAEKVFKTIYNDIKNSKKIKQIEEKYDIRIKITIYENNLIDAIYDYMYTGKKE